MTPERDTPQHALSLRQHQNAWLTYAGAKVDYEARLMELEISELLIEEPSVFLDWQRASQELRISLAELRGWFRVLGPQWG